MMLDRPLGIGAIEFGRTFGEDEHDIWLKTLTTYGWLGFCGLPDARHLDTHRRLPAGLPRGPLQSVTQIAYIVFLGHILMATVIDIDHWRHVYLLFGILWGAIAADRSATQKRLSAWLRD